MGWIFDEEISQPTAQLFQTAGLKGKHLKHDLGFGGITDDQVLQVIKKEGKTLITIDDDFCTGYGQIIKDTPGVFYVGSKDPDEQVSLVRRASRHPVLNTAKKRWGKTAVIYKNALTVKDHRRQQQEDYTFN